MGAGMNRFAFPIGFVIIWGLATVPVLTLCLIALAAALYGLGARL